MSRARSRKPRHPKHDVPEAFGPGAPPVEPDGAVSPVTVPEDPEQERVIAPGPTPARPAERSRRQGEPATPLRAVRAPESAAGLALPHERDQSNDVTADAPDPLMVQAQRDIDAGMVDTDMRATPGLDAKRRARLVPGPGGKPPPADD